MDVSNLADEEILRRYAELGDLLNDTIAGLAELQFEHRRNEQSWSIREIIHHIIDADFLVQNIILAALGNSGCRYDQSWYKTDNSWATTLVYNRRPVKPALDLFSVSHQHVVILIEQIADALDRFVLIKIENKADWKKVTVRQLLLGRLYHTDHHLRQIEETRRKHWL